jgi:3-oxoacyl-[acyl-carrier protein] reductase
MGTLKGKNALVTGTSQGIGAAIARQLIDAGCNVCMHYVRSSEEPGRLKTAALERGQQAALLHADLTREEEVIRCIKDAVECFGSFDVLVNNSGALVERRMLSAVDLAYWNRLIDINMTSMMLVTREIIPYLNTRDGSSIVNLSSLAGRKGGHAGSLVYATAKGAVLTWTRALATELAGDGIRVNAVAPGFIEGTSFHARHTSRESSLETIAGIPLGRSGNPADVARAVTFLASEYDGFITGETIDINGGVYAA